MNICYKLAPKHKSGVFLSYNIWLGDLKHDEIEDRPTLLTYEIGKQTRPKIECSRLFCFDTFENAYYFYGHTISPIGKEYHILVCQAGEIEKYTKNAIPTGNCANFWKFYQEFVINDGFYVPFGTVLTDWVIPLASVNVEDIKEL